MDDLDNLRSVIDECDKEIVQAIEKRFKTVNRIVKYKKANNMEIFQPSRESEVLEKVNSYLSNEEFSEEVKSLYIKIMDISKELQKRIL